MSNVVEQTRQIVKYTRQRIGLSVREASELAGVKPDQWTHFELRGKSVPKFFGSMCRALDLDPIQLLKMEGIL